MKYSFQDLRNAIEIEMQKTINPVVAANIAMSNLKDNPEYYKMQKAKYIKRYRKGNKWVYVYPDDKTIKGSKKVEEKKNENKRNQQELPESTKKLKSEILATTINLEYKKEWESKNKLNLLGQTIKSPEDFAYLANIYRNPQFETFRIIMTKGNKVVAQTGISTRLPSSCAAFVEMSGEDPVGNSINRMKDIMKKSGADGYYLLHNHPSGNVESSSQDIRITKMYSDLLPGFKSHVIINHNKFNSITNLNLSQGTDNIKNLKKPMGKDKFFRSFEGESILGKKMDDPYSVVEIVKKNEIVRKNMVTVFALGPQLRVTGIMNIPSKEFSNEKVLKQIKEFALNNGSSSVMIADSEESVLSSKKEKSITKAKIFIKGIKEKYFLDVISNDGNSLRDVYDPEREFAEFGEKTIKTPFVVNEILQENLEKARPTKYISKKKVKGKWQYTYADTTDKKSKKEEPETKEESNVFEKIMSFFGFSSQKEAFNKIKQDYETLSLDKQGVTWDRWKDHVSEYFANKEKWDNFFSKKSQKSEPTGDNKDKKDSKPKQKTKKKERKINLSIMKALFSLYGGAEKVATPVEQEDNFDTMPEGESEKIEEEKKKYDKIVSDKINEVTPETRNSVEREILEIPEPESKEDIERPVENFIPTETEITIPFYKGAEETLKAKDYSSVIPKNIYLVSQKEILEKERPSYIPEVNESYFKNSSYFIPTYKLGEDKYVIKTSSEIRYNFSGDSTGKDEYVIVNRDVLAATQDYYIKKAKQAQKVYEEDRDKQYGRKMKKKRISMVPANKLSYNQVAIIRSFEGPIGSQSREMWAKYGEIRDDISQKTSDMNIQIEEHYNAYSKGVETSYGDVGLNDSLYDKYGVKVKRQNGDDINDSEISEIQSAIESVFSVFGDRSSMCKNFGLKISHSGDKKMHARKAVGLFIPSMKAIGVTAKYEGSGTGFILSHEFGHFMDNYLGFKNQRHYLSDDPNSIAGKIASTFRKNMTKNQKSDYTNRTCECFARAMEQYWAMKTGETEIFTEFDSGNHPSKEDFNEKVLPLIEEFFLENKELLKALWKNKTIFIKKV